MGWSRTINGSRRLQISDQWEQLRRRRLRRERLAAKQAEESPRPASAGTIQTPASVAVAFLLFGAATLFAGTPVRVVSVLATAAVRGGNGPVAGDVFCGSPNGCAVYPQPPRANAVDNPAAADVSPVRLQALALVESGNNPAAIGKAGETTQYQMIPAVRRQYGSAAAVLQARCNAFTAAQQRPCTDAEFYLLWHRPARVLHPRRVELARAHRFAATVNQLKGHHD